LAFCKSGDRMEHYIHLLALPLLSAIGVVHSNYYRSNRHLPSWQDMFKEILNFGRKAFAMYVGITWSVSLLPVHSAGCAVLPSVFEGGLPSRLQGRVRLPPGWACRPGAGALAPPPLRALRGRK
jgi:hypothetical protein